MAIPPIPYERLNELCERVEKATGPNREIDAEIDSAFYGGFPSHLCHDRTRRSYGTGYIHNVDDGTNLTQGGRVAPSYTASIDAALALVGRMLPGWVCETLGQDAVGNLRSMHGIGWTAEFSNGRDTHQGQAPTLPLAILSALLLALSHTQEPDNDDQH